MRRSREAAVRRLVSPALAFLIAAGPVAAQPQPKPQRIMSLMQCTDLLLLSLVPAGRIASVTHLAHEPVAAIMPGRDRGIRVNHGSAEEILRDRPDLILAGTFTTPAARRLAARIGARIVEVAPAESFADIRATTRRIGAHVGEQAQAEALIARMDDTLRRLAAARPIRPKAVVAWNGSGYVPGQGTLTDAIIRAAGAINVASRPSVRQGSFGLEELLAVHPDAILVGRNGWRGPSLTAARAGHPLVGRLYRDRRIGYSEPLFACGLPQSADSASALHRSLLALPAGRAAR